jgi:CRISPR-associated protein (TIGR02584 family)
VRSDNWIVNMTENDASTETILLAVTGMSPAILTETLWALAHEEESVIPHRIIAVTTLAGRERIAVDLFSPQEGLGGLCAWDALRASLTAAGHDISEKLRFGTTPDDLRVITAMDPATSRSIELADLRSRVENEAAADFLLDQVRGITANPDTRLIASIAGGRKTMGALLYACLTLAGREQDRLTHVLVNEPYETLPGFFFPSQPGPSIADRSGQRTYAAEAAIVELADVPFVPIRNLFQRELGRAAGSFSHLIASCRSGIRHRAAEDLRLEIFLHRAALRLNQAELRLTDREHHLLLCLAGRAKHEHAPVPSYIEALDTLAHHAKEWQSLIENGRLRAGTPSAAGFHDEQDIRRVLSDLRKKLKSLGPAGLILADALPERGRFSLDVPGPLISIL